MDIYLGLGSNLGDRESQLRAALTSLNNNGVRVVRSASVYLTEPRDYADQPWFLNTVVQADTELEPQDLLQRCLRIEREAGRNRTTPNGPRTLDIDIVFYADRVIDLPGLTIPHPRYAGRRFVLEPLAEIAPNLIDPKRGVRVRDLLEQSSDDAVISVYGRPLL